MKSLDHFIDLALQGKRPGSSGGEKRARRLARCILDNVPGLDDSAINGMIEFIRAAQLQPETARSAVDAWGDK